MLVLVMVSLLVAMFAVIFVNDLVRQNQQLQRTTDALAQAKEALIGWSVQRTPSIPLPNARPGELPCPDNNNDGFEDGTCVAGALGRMPWKTLGIPEPRDGAGETLWYAMAGPFRIWAVNSNPINSDTKGNITVYSGSSSTVMTLEAVAVIFAPGAVLGTQDRSCTVGVNCTATGQCTTSPASLTPKCNPTNYLDTTGGANNATTNGPYISAQASNTFNDRLLVITTDSLMTPVEQRVAREMLKLLQLYKANSGCNCYPWPDLSTGFSDFGLNRGRIPGYDLGATSPPYALPVDWGVGGAPTLPQWFIDNGWRRIIYYAVGRNFLESSGAGCTSCETGQTTLSVNNVPGTEVVMLTPGPAGAGRPVAYPWTNWVPYLEDPENKDNSNDHYETPLSSAYSRDRIYTIP